MPNLQHIGYLALVLSFCFYVKALIEDPVSQGSELNTYADSQKFYHAFFDISFLDGGNMVQGDKDHTYFFGRTSSRSIETFQFVQTENDGSASQILHEDVHLENYKVYGMCQHEGTLDYLVSKHLESEEIRVLKLKKDEDVTDRLVIDTYKTIDKDEYLNLQDEIHVDCTRDGSYKGKNTYTMAVGGTYFHENGLSSYYLAKFSTRFNLTEYFVKSEDDTVMEQLKGVRVDTDNEMIYAAVEVNKNMYHGMTVYEPGTLPDPENSNIAIIGFHWRFANRQWVVVAGNQKFQDNFVNMEPLGNHLYVALNSFSTEYSTNSSQHDIYFYDINTWNGYTNKVQKWGSPTDDKAFDMHVNQLGIYILAEIGDNFRPHRDTSYEWSTQNNVANLVLMWIDFDSEIVNMEGYALGNLEEPHSRKFVLNQLDEVRNQYTFYTHRSQDFNGGNFITHFKTPADVFTTDSCTVTNCAFCDSKHDSFCFKCKANYFLFEHTCYATACPQGSYEVFAEDGSTRNFCLPCHYSCKTCSGPKEYECQSCCQSLECGAVYDRVPDSGYCKCDTGLKEANGKCLSRCLTDLKGIRGDHCFTQCPDNSYPFIKHDGVAAQERSQYDTSSACIEYDYHLQFDKDGKGLAVLGPKGLNSMLREFTLSFWIYPTDLTGSSILLNFFNRVHIARDTNDIKFKYYISNAGTSQPSYTADDYIVANTWNYITASQEEFLDGTVMKYRQQLGIARGRSANLLDAGYDDTDNAVFYPYFVNTIHIGSESDQDPQSFSGLLKEVKLFNSYHSLPQMIDEKLRIMRYYSFDDPNLIAYWKLTEEYGSDALEYTVRDYSMYQNSITYSQISDPDYPVFIQDTFNILNLCFYHDVAECKSVDFEDSHHIVATGRRLTFEPTMTVKDDTLYSISDGDEMWFLPNNTQCSQHATEKLAYLKYSTVHSQWMVDDMMGSPTWLPEAKHYQVCYYIADLDIYFNLMQVYVAGIVRTIQPSNSDIFQISAVYRDFYTYGGDQAFGDIIKLSKDCDYPDGLDFDLVRDVNGEYDEVEIDSLQTTGEFRFCWQPQFILESFDPHFEAIHGLRYKVISRPQIKTTAPPSVEMNERPVNFDYSGSFVDGDQLTMSWKGENFADCKPINFMGEVYTYNHTSWPAVWFGYSSGIHGIDSYKKDELHICWKPSAKQAPDAWIRLKKTTGGAYQIRVNEYDVAVNQECPELTEFNPVYGSSTLTESDTEIKFKFLDREVIPSKDGAVNGKIKIFRGAIRPDGEVIQMTEELWSKTDLDHTVTDPFTQGDLICTLTGSCTIFLSQASSRMKAGEAFFLSFYPKSFAAYDGGVAKWLFENAATLPGQDYIYSHLFFARSFSVSASDQLIQGSTFQIKGEDLKFKEIYLKEQSGKIEKDIFHTAAINLYMTIENTNSPYCVGELMDPPVATVIPEDIEDEMFTVRNLELGECLEGDIFATVEMIRGIMSVDGEFSHQRREKMYGIKLGTIQCHESCLSCNGTTSTDCTICADQKKFLYYGECRDKCPSNAQTYLQKYTDFQSKRFGLQLCLPECPAGMYANEETMVCQECNPDCQTCSSSLIASCNSCKPIKYLLNGICIKDCPSPHHINNYAEYECNQVSRTPELQVQIQSLGYKNRVPKDQKIYLKVNVISEDDDKIVSIKWTQVEPEIKALSDLNSIFEESDSPGQYQDDTAVIPIRSQSFNFMASSRPVKVQATITTASGLQNYDVYEFYLNDPPATSEMEQDIVWTEDDSDAFKSIDSIVKYKLGDWYDNSDDTSVQLDIFAYALVDGHFSLWSEALRSTEFYIRPPLVVSDKTLSKKEVTVCFQAVDAYQAIAENCYAEAQITNKQALIEDYDAIATLLKPLDYANMTNIVFASNVMYFGLKSPGRKPIFPGICTMNFHCNSNGDCGSAFGIQRCTCNQGYQGTYCDYYERELADLQGIASAMIDTIYDKYTNKFEIQALDIIMIAHTLRGVAKSPDLITDEYFKKVLELITLASNSEIYAHWPLTESIQEMCLETLDLLILKLNHAYKKNRAYEDTDGLGEGQTLQEYTASLGSNSQVEELRRNLQETNITHGRNLVQEKVTPIGGKTNPIGGKPKQERKLFSQAKADQFEAWGRRLDSAVNNFIGHISQRLGPAEPLSFYKGEAFEMYLEAAYANTFKNKYYKIKNNDIFWHTPSTLFKHNQGMASDAQFVKLRAIKWQSNPYLFEQNPHGHAENNVTTFGFYNTAGMHIDVKLDESDPVSIVEPYTKSEGYQAEFIGCMAWNQTQNKYDNDDSCTFNEIQRQLLCDDCEGNEVTTQVSVCRCTHMSVFSIAYEKTSPASGKGPVIGLYSDFFALGYWLQSFGFMAVCGGLSFFFLGHLIIYFIDWRLQEKMILKLRNKVRQIEQKTHQGGLTKKSLAEMNDDQDDSKQGLNQSEEIDPGRSVFRESSKKGPTKKRLTKKAKNVDQDADNLEEEKEAGPDAEQVKNKLFGMFGGGGGGAGSQSDNPGVVPDEPPANYSGGEEEFQDQDQYYAEDFDAIEEKREKKDKKKKKKKKRKESIEEVGQTEEAKDSNEHGTDRQNSSGGNEEKPLKQQKSAGGMGGALMQNLKAAVNVNVNHAVDNEDKDRAPKDFNEAYLAKKQRDEDKNNPILKRYRKREAKRNEQRIFQAKQMVIRSNLILSMIFITSIHSPRHVRWTLLIATLTLLWFCTAVIYNNTKDPLEIPDFSREGKNLAGDELWISFVSPFGTMILMYVFTGLFKISEDRIKSSTRVEYLDKMVVELKKEMKLRFIMGYFITVGIFAMVYWYIISFTATFGWKISWAWWWSGIYAIIFHFFLIDPLISLSHAVIYKCSRQLALYIMRVRQIKHADEEGA